MLCSSCSIPRITPVLKMSTSGKQKQLKELPGSYGIPFFGALKDRLDFFWFQGDTEFFRIRMEKYKSTVFRVNYSPGPPGYPDPRGVILLDQKSYSVLLDSSKVDKTDTLVGPYIPSLAFNGGYRALHYLDTTEEKHTLYKELVFELLRLNFPRMLPEYSKVFAETSQAWETTLAESGKADVLSSADAMMIKFLLRTLLHRDPEEPGPASLGKDFRNIYQLWIGIQFAGIAHTGLPHIIEEIFLHSFRLPFFLVKHQDNALAKFHRTYATEALDIAQNKFGLDREETVYILIVLIANNARLGLMKMIPPLVYYLAKLGAEFQAKIAEEVRAAVKSNGGLTTKALLEMPLVKSTVLETLRLMPSVFYTYGRAREDMIVESHDAKFQIKKGELLGGHLYFVMRDPKVFKDPHKFIPERFMGEEGEALLPYLVWSNGRDTDSPAATNKQCPAKNYVELLTCQFIAEMFLKYDSFEITPDSKISTTELSVSFKSLKKRAAA